MESASSLDAKYNKLATGYSKLRGQVTVLKQALLEEQGKSSTMRETLRQKDTALRRAEQEVDSLGFRNKQLEHRVASLQEDLNRETKHSTKAPKSSSKIKTNTESYPSINDSDTIFTEELQKKILENAQLTSLIADKDADIDLYKSRIVELEQQERKRSIDHTELERKLRKEIESLSIRNSALEAKLAEGISIVGSEDALSCSENEHTPIHRNSTSSDERIAQLEKDVFHWKTKYEICKISGDNKADGKIPAGAEPTAFNNGPSCSSTASDLDHDTGILSTEQLIHNHFMVKFDNLFAEKCLAESKLTSFMVECDSLFNNLEILTNELDDKEQKYIESQKDWQRCEEDLATTRINYEEQISVLTEQVISLSDQLAALK